MRVVDAIIARLEAKGVGTGGATIFAGSDANLPDGDDPPFLSLAESGGPSPTRFHNTTPLRHPSFQVTSRGGDYDAVAALADLAWNALGGDEVIANVTIGGVFFLDIHPVGEIMQLPADAQQRVRLVFNIETKRR